MAATQPGASVVDSKWIGCSVPELVYTELKRREKQNLTLEPAITATNSHFYENANLGPM
jgi:hypothetical protein